MSRIETLAALREHHPAPQQRAVLKQLAALDVHARRFIELAPFVVIASGGANHRDASPRGGAPGFVKAPDVHTLLLPDSPGNNRLDTLQNILESPHVGLLFMVPGVDETLRIRGRAELRTDLDLREACRDARRVPTLVIRVHIDACFLHCAKASMRASLWDVAQQQPRDCMPCMGEMLRDQIAGRESGAEFETQDEMLERYRGSL
jgi:hypothetical protein